MRFFNLKTVLATVIASSLLTGCLSTSPYKPQSNEGFEYNKDMSFAMNVMEGSLELHNGLRDAELPENADISLGADYVTADGIIGFINGGLGGSLLSMLGSNTANKPLHTYYSIVYYPIESNESVQQVFTKIEQELIDETIKYSGLEFVNKTLSKRGKTLLKFKGNACLERAKKVTYDVTDTCNYVHYNPPKLLKYTKSTPNGEKGNFAVVGFESFYGADLLAFELDKKFYTFFPTLPLIKDSPKFPFVAHAQKIHLFIKPNKEQPSITFLTIDDLKTMSPWVKIQYEGKH